MENKLFTVKEANALLPQLRADLIRIQALLQQFEDKYVTLEQFKMSHAQSLAYDVTIDPQADPFFELEGQLDFMRMEAEMQIENFSRKGVLLKMISPGLIDFPAMINGHNALLCWKEGEDEVGHYHSWEDGFAGRRPLEQ
ncbi:DUF2203 family protein [Paenibacillaceae bacterium]|nr:DUF2203 family protein [Paenibacillaceae bacterium]